MINVHGICDILHSKVANKYWELAVHYQLSKNFFLNIWAGWNLSVLQSVCLFCGSVSCWCFKFLLLGHTAASALMTTELKAIIILEKK